MESSITSETAERLSTGTAPPVLMMAGQKGQNMDRKWTDGLTGGVYTRLCNCRTKKFDLPILVSAMWLHFLYIGKAANGFTRKDALLAVLEILDCNSCYFDLTLDEYEALCK